MDPRIAHPDQIAYVRESTIHGGPGHGMRAIDVAPYDGLQIRVLPDRGLDIGRAAYRGVPVNWTSSVGESGPHTLAGEDAWLDHFGGGLVTTCGLRNVGAASEGHGLHGRYSHLPARDVAITRRELDERTRIEITGTVEETSSLGHRLRLERRIAVESGRGLLEFEDVTTNLGRDAEPTPILYHVNLGYPFLDECTTFEIGSSRTIARDADARAAGDRWKQPGGADVDLPPVVVEHVIDADDAGRAHARVTNPRLGLEVSLSWPAEALPRLHQWLHLAPGVYVVALEPANCSVLGRAADRAADALPVLEPDGRRRTALLVEMRALG